MVCIAGLVRDILHRRDGKWREGMFRGERGRGFFGEFVCMGFFKRGAFGMFDRKIGRFFVDVTKEEGRRVKKKTI